MPPFTLEMLNPEPETRNPKPDALHAKCETRNTRYKTRNTKAENRHVQALARAMNCDPPSRLLRLSARGQVNPHPETINSQWMGESSLETLALHQSRTFSRPRNGRWLQAPGTTFLDAATAGILCIPTWLYKPVMFVFGPVNVGMAGEVPSLASVGAGEWSEIRSPKPRDPTPPAPQTPKPFTAKPCTPSKPDTIYTKHRVLRIQAPYPLKSEPYANTL